MAYKVSLMWFRQDLRLTDNLALLKACEAENCLLIYIVDPTNSGDHFYPGAASNLWLNQSLEQLNEASNGNLMCYRGDPKKILPELIRRFNIDCVYWNRTYEPWQVARDKAVKSECRALAQCESFNGSLLWEPWEVFKKDGAPYKIFTPFYHKGCLNAPKRRSPYGKAKLPKILRDSKACKISQLQLMEAHDYARSLSEKVEAGELSANEKLEKFINQNISHYKIARDFPSENATSSLSAHLHFGEISPHQVFQSVLSQVEPSNNRDHFLMELAWREFSYYQLYHFPKLPIKNFKQKFDDFPWQENSLYLRSWQQGKTGYPLIDAGMSELWQTGHMHNRVRMLVGSFLVKNLRIHWQKGARWFWDCLFDADLASNSAGWQWVAGSGADAAPYFRIFNPTTQAKRFDPEGRYIRHFVPELKNLPIKYLFEPWLAPEAILINAGITLGENYPKPIVDLKKSREQALAAFFDLKRM